MMKCAVIHTRSSGRAEKIGPGAENQRDGHAIGKAELEIAVWPGLPKQSQHQQQDLRSIDDKVNLDLLFVTLLNWIILVSDYLHKAAHRHHLHLQMH